MFRLLFQKASLQLQLIASMSNLWHYDSKYKIRGLPGLPKGFNNHARLELPNKDGANKWFVITCLPVF